MGSRVLAPALWYMGLVAPRHVGSSWTADWTRVPCIDRQILYHWAAREALICWALLWQGLKHQCSFRIDNSRLGGGPTKSNQWHWVIVYMTYQTLNCSFASCTGQVSPLTKREVCSGNLSRNGFIRRIAHRIYEAQKSRNDPKAAEKLSLLIP